MLSVIVPDLGLLSRWRDAARLAAEVEVVDRDSIFDGMLQEAIATPEIQDEVQSQPIDVTELKESAWESSDELWRSAAEKVRLVEELEDQLRAVQRELLRTVPEFREVEAAETQAKAVAQDALAHAERIGLRRQDRRYLRKAEEGRRRFTEAAAALEAELRTMQARIGGGQADRPVIEPPERDSEAPPGERGRPWLKWLRWRSRGSRTDHDAEAEEMDLEYERLLEAVQRQRTAVSDLGNVRMRLEDRLLRDFRGHPDLVALRGQIDSAEKSLEKALRE